MFCKIRLKFYTETVCNYMVVTYCMSWGQNINNHCCIIIILIIRMNITNAFYVLIVFSWYTCIFIKIEKSKTPHFVIPSHEWPTFLNTKGSSSYTGLMALFGTILVLYFLLTVSAGKPYISTSTHVPTFLSDSHWPEIT